MKLIKWAACYNHLGIRSKYSWQPLTCNIAGYAIEQGTATAIFKMLAISKIKYRKSARMATVPYLLIFLVVLVHYVRHLCLNILCKDFAKHSLVFVRKVHERNGRLSSDLLSQCCSFNKACLTSHHFYTCTLLMKIKT